jgi:hypothetical protein
MKAEQAVAGLLLTGIGRDLGRHSDDRTTVHIGGYLKSIWKKPWRRAGLAL